MLDDPKSFHKSEYNLAIYEGYCTLKQINYSRGLCHLQYLLSTGKISNRLTAQTLTSLCRRYLPYDTSYLPYDYFSYKSNTTKLHSANANLKLHND